MKPRNGTICRSSSLRLSSLHQPLLNFTWNSNDWVPSRTCLFRQHWDGWMVFGWFLAGSWSIPSKIRWFIIVFHMSRVKCFQHILFTQIQTMGFYWPVRKGISQESHGFLNSSFRKSVEHSEAVRRSTQHFGPIPQAPARVADLEAFAHSRAARGWAAPGSLGMAWMSWWLAEDVARCDVNICQHMSTAVGISKRVKKRRNGDLSKRFMGIWGFWHFLWAGLGSSVIPGPRWLLLIELWQV
jgi:hypothetical protein